MHKLSEADSRAIDQFLETRNAAADGGSPAAETPDKRLATAAELFDLIGVMPAFEPSADLSARTLQTIARIERRRRHAANAGEIDATQQIPPLL